LKLSNWFSNIFPRLRKLYSVLTISFKQFFKKVKWKLKRFLNVGLLPGPPFGFRKVRLKSIVSKEKLFIVKLHELWENLNLVNWLLRKWKFMFADLKIDLLYLLLGSH
jgi:hypothetical protein